MQNSIRGYTAAPFRYFSEISAIPRASGNEAGIADYLVDFAREKGLEVYRDALSNVLIRKPAAKGREGEPPLLLQAHTDMVAEKHSHVQHDFATAPIRFLQTDNILRADGTTLGADDGVGVAMMLAVLASDEISHPALECLFTVSEETGLEGAFGFDYGRITARRMLNLDSAEEDTVIIGCCGGLRSDMTLPVTFEKTEGEALRITLSGLCGGHSGEDIDKGRGNAHVLMGRVLQRLPAGFRLVSLHGGDKDNAIPRECEAVIVTDREKGRGTAELLTALAAEVPTWAAATEDAGLTLDFEQVTAAAAMTAADTAKLLQILSVRNGVLYKRTTPPIMPETSRNLARIRTEREEGVVTVGFSSRSEREDRIEESRRELDALAVALGGSVHHHAGYPGWVSPADSPLVTCWQQAYQKTCGKGTVPALIHAGLECGLISAALEGLEAISVGCNIHDLHTPAEALELDSMARIWQTVIVFLGMI